MENLNLLFINLLLMIKFYIPWEWEGVYDERFERKKNTGTDIKQKYESRISFLLKKIQEPCVHEDFFVKLII